MPFIRVSFDGSGQAARSLPKRERVFVINDSGFSITVIDGANNFVLNNNAMASWSVDPGAIIAFVGTAASTFLFGWGDFDLDLIPGTANSLQGFGYDQILQTFAFNASVASGRKIAAGLIDSAGNEVVFSAANPGGLTKGVPVKLATGQSVGVTSLPTIASINAQGQVATTLGVVTPIFTYVGKSIVVRNLGAGDVDVGDPTVTFGAGFRLVAKEAVFLVINNQAAGAGFTLYAIDNGLSTGTLSWIGFS